MRTDAELIQEYAEAKAEAAFRELVERHLNLVYSTALRLVAGTGVRPSPGAETSEYPVRSNFAKAFGTSKLAAPGDGRTPVQGFNAGESFRRILSQEEGATDGP